MSGKGGLTYVKRKTATAKTADELKELAKTCAIRVDSLKLLPAVERSKFDRVGYELTESFYLWCHNKLERPSCGCGAPVKFISLSSGYSARCDSCKATKRACSSRQSLELGRRASAAKRALGQDPAWTAEARLARASTNVERYGSAHAWGSGSSARAKAAQTLSSTYGTSNPFEATSTPADRRLWSLKGVTPEALAERAVTNVARYGVEHFVRSEAARSKLVEARRLAVIKRCAEHGYTLLGEYVNAAAKTLWRHECGQEFYDHADNGAFPSCVKCVGASFEARTAISISQFLKDEPYSLRDRSVIHPYELDIYYPKLNAAVELHGNYWHGATKETDDVLKPRHKQKALLAKQAGVKLIQVYEDELTSQAFKLLASMLSVRRDAVRVAARKAKVVELTSAEAKTFFELHHLKGYVNGSVRLGLTYEGQLVQAIVVGRSRFDRGAYELYRLASSIGIVVIGGASKLISALASKLSGRLISYADGMYSTGELYTTLGFKQVTALADAEPSYKWWRRDGSVSRYQAQKHRLAALLPSYEPTLSEADNMFYAGYLRNWETGSMKFELSL